MADIFEPRFLLASLHIEAILRGTTVARRRKALKSIKDGVGLGNAYSATLERIKTQGEEKANFAMAALTWICHSERPLGVDELCHALAVEIGESDFDPENIPSLGTLLDCCQGLIIVDAEASTVRLIHYTVQEYLCTYPGLFSRPHSILAETCLTYLNSRQVKNLTPHSPLGYRTIPFLKYSARYWGTHMNKDLSDHARAFALELLNNFENHIAAVSLQEQVLQPYEIEEIATSPLFSGLHCASFFGIVELVTVLITAEGYDKQDCVGRTPLAWAARKGHEGVVRVLLERKNVDPNRPDIYDRTPLGWAAIEGHEGVVKILLERESVDPNRPDMDGEGPLGGAALYGHEGVVKLLLDRGDVDRNRPGIKDQTPLASAAVNGHEGVVKLLLEQEIVDPNRPNRNDRTPLGYAALNGHEGVVKLLLEREDVDPNCPDKYGYGPLGLAAFYGYEGVVKLLLQRETVDPNRPDVNDQTPLGWAAFGGHKGVVKLLLERGDVDPNHPDKYGVTPLSHALRRGHGSIVPLLQSWKSVETPDPQLLHQL